MFSFNKDESYELKKLQTKKIYNDLLKVYIKYSDNEIIREHINGYMSDFEMLNDDLKKMINKKLECPTLDLAG